MIGRTVIAAALAFAPIGCAEKPMRVTSAAQAIEVAKIELERQGYAPAGRYEVTGDGVVWVVVPHPQPAGPGYSVLVDPASGKAEIGAYQTATIDEEL
ncbi:MAG: hypothetical protein C0481_11095 [Phenylobacterium sp.]|uniref:hypothetical protein n=1 Tax=Phenylobacterium sp. TaxID=1871053 RepID=UPI0025FF1121|nr:hypothetical protein [Phenylobacterium sp.]MBA4012402.1 hypothetical protein [Phenylobacterium sp.]